MYENLKWIAVTHLLLQLLQNAWCLLFQLFTNFLSWTWQCYKFLMLVCTNACVVLVIFPCSGYHFSPELGEVTRWSGARSVSWYSAEASQELWPGYGPGNVPYTIQSVHEHCVGSGDGTVQCLADVYPKQPYQCSEGYKRWTVTLMSKADCSYVNFVCSLLVCIIFIGKFIHIF